MCRRGHKARSLKLNLLEACGTCRDQTRPKVESEREHDDVIGEGERRDFVSREPGYSIDTDTRWLMVTTP